MAKRTPEGSVGGMNREKEEETVRFLNGDHKGSCFNKNQSDPSLQEQGKTSGNMV